MCLPVEDDLWSFKQPIKTSIRLIHYNLNFYLWTFKIVWTLFLIWNNKIITFLKLLENNEQKSQNGGAMLLLSVCIDIVFNW